MKKIFLTFLVLSFSCAAMASVKETWNCYRDGSEFLQMSFDGKSYSATLQGVLEKISLKGNGDLPIELKGREEPFYDTINYTIKINRSKISPVGPERELIQTTVGLHRDGYWDCYGRFTDAETLECSVEIERD